MMAIWITRFHVPETYKEVNLMGGFTRSDNLSLANETLVEESGSGIGVRPGRVDVNDHVVRFKPVL